MLRAVPGLLLILAVLTGFSPLVTFPVIAGTDNKVTEGDPFLSVGKIRPDAIPFSVWTTPPQDSQLKAGDRVTVHFKAESSCYLVVANVSEKGDVTIVFPNKETPDNAMEAGKEYTLFGDESKLKLVVGQKVARTNLVFYVSSRPLTFVRIPIKRLVMRIQSDRKEALQSLRQQIEKIAETKGFNRKVLAIKTDRIGAANLKLMGGKVKGAPWKDTSETPESVTGTQGQHEKITPE